MMYLRLYLQCLYIYICLKKEIPVDYVVYFGWRNSADTPIRMFSSLLGVGVIFSKLAKSSTL